MTRRHPIKIWSTDPDAPREPRLVDADGTDYVYGAEAIEAFREDLGLDAEPRSPRSSSGGMVHDIHRCAPPATRGYARGSVWRCDYCGRFAELHRYSPPGRYAKPYRFEWRSVGWFKQGRYEHMYG